MGSPVPGIVEGERLPSRGLRDGPAARDHAGIPQIVLATDLSAASAGAADRAIELAIERAAHLIVLSVVDPIGLRLPGGRFVRRIDQERTRVERGAQALVLRARSAGVRATFLVWEGDVVETILLAAEAEGAELIVLGTHERGRLGRLVSGSVSARVAQAARCEVSVVPRGTSA